MAETTFPEKVKRLRELLNLSQPELAHKLGVHPVTVGNWERGVQHPIKCFARWIETELAKAVAK